MPFSFTPAAAQKLLAIMAGKSGSLALRIDIHRGLGGTEWRMTLEPRTADALMVDGVPVHASPATLKQLEGLIIDWVMTPDGPGLGVYDKSLIERDLRHE
jgi:Fe-S cluster assembly iron-binding protein IscA